MRRFHKFLLPLALLASGCGADSLRRLGLKERVDEEKSVVSLSEAFVVGCGPTANAPGALRVDGMETFGCTVFSRDERRKVESALALFQVNVFFPDGGFDPRPATAEHDEAKPWHAYFNLRAGAFPEMTRIEVKARYGDAETALNSAGLVVYDPEGLSDRDERENTFVPRQGADPAIDFKQVDGHILFVTGVDMVPGQDFNSIEGADLRCSIEAQKVVKLAVYRFFALLSDATRPARDRVAIKGPIRNFDEEIVLEDGPQLFESKGFDGNLQVVGGDLASNALRVWTGTAEKNCANWGSKDPAQMAAVGDPSSELWQNAGESACSTGRRIYCISR